MRGRHEVCFLRLSVSCAFGAYAPFLGPCALGSILWVAVGWSAARLPVCRCDCAPVSRFVHYSEGVRRCVCGIEHVSFPISHIAWGDAVCRCDCGREHRIPVHLPGESRDGVALFVPKLFLPGFER